MIYCIYQRASVTMLCPSPRQYTVDPVPVFVQYPSMTMKLYSILVNILLYTQAPIPICLDGTIVDSSTILETM